jgi:hypothetical protein
MISNRPWPARGCPAEICDESAIAWKDAGKCLFGSNVQRWGGMQRWDWIRNFKLGGQVMRKVFLSLIVLSIVCWSCGTVFGQGKGRGRGRGGRGRQGSEAKEKGRGRGKAREEAAKAEGGKGKAAKKESGKGKGKRKGKSEEEGEAVEADAGKGKGKGRGKAKEEGEAAETASAEGKGKGKGRAREEAKARGKGHQQQLKALEKQMLREDAKHNKRAARLQRILDLAKEKGDTKAVERVTKLMGREQQRYEGKHQRMVERRGRIEQFGEAEGADDEEAAEGAKVKAKGKGKGRGKGKGGEQDKDEDDEDKDEDKNEDEDKDQSGEKEAE